jgi:hypothetical protein
MELERQAGESREGRVATLFVGIVYDNDAVYQLTVHRPLDFVLAVDAGSNEASLMPGMAGAGRREPRVMVAFEGNPDAGGVEVHQEGAAP